MTITHTPSQLLPPLQTPAGGDVSMLSGVMTPRSGGAGGILMQPLTKSSADQLNFQEDGSLVRDPSALLNQSMTSKENLLC